MNRLPGKKNPPPEFVEVNVSDDMLELMRRRYREATGEDPPSDEELVRLTLRQQMILSLFDPNFAAIIEADTERSPADRELIRSYIERCVAEAVANGREVETGIDGPLTPEAIMEQARKIAEN